MGSRMILRLLICNLDSIKMGYLLLTLDFKVLVTLLNISTRQTSLQSSLPSLQFECDLVPA